MTDSSAWPPLHRERGEATQGSARPVGVALLHCFAPLAKTVAASLSFPIGHGVRGGR
ncbi:hypothetical protein SAMN04487845_12516 [Methylobacterium sp. yr668]|nr:hypothetical protein SAMN04487845_12516 [Methylobacterium sp. yr668]